MNTTQSTKERTVQPLVLHPLRQQHLFGMASQFTPDTILVAHGVSVRCVLSLWPAQRGQDNMDTRAFFFLQIKIKQQALVQATIRGHTSHSSHRRGEGGNKPRLPRHRIGFLPGSFLALLFFFYCIHPPRLPLRSHLPFLLLSFMVLWCWQCPFAYTTMFFHECMKSPIDVSSELTGLTP